MKTVFLYVEKIPSIPNVGNRSIGIGEKYLRPIDSSGFFRTLAMSPEKVKIKIEKARPVRNKTFETL